VEKCILKSYTELKKLSPEELVEKRMNKFIEMGVFQDA
jgi:acetyl-CoA carboxylase carboxyl transferase subunit alpha